MIEIAENEIRYLPNPEIDKVKWNHCIDVAQNGLIYAYSFYLDHMSKQWDALVLGDYEAVMPLTWNKKYGIFYLYQPFLAASLGVFSLHVDSTLLEKFFRQIPRKFRYWDIYLNHGNLFRLKTFTLYERTNHVLYLNKPYDTIFKNYRENVKRNIRKALQIGCTTQKNLEVNEVISLSIEQFKTFTQVQSKDFDNFRNLYRYLQNLKKAVTYGILSPHGQLLASCVFFFSHKRAYYILVGNHPNGKTLGASHALVDSFIRDYANHDLSLDFEGSDVSKIAYFFKGFGAVEEKYPGLLYNRLPPLLKWLKS